MPVPADRSRADQLRDPLTSTAPTGSRPVTGGTGATAVAAVGAVGAPRGDGSPEDGSSDGSGTAPTAKAEATGVATEAAEQGRRVAGAAGEQASQVASEAGRQARDLLGQTRGQLTEQASAGQRRAASGLNGLAGELTGLAEGRAGSGVATDLVHQASQRVGALGSWLEDREPADVLREVQGFARRRPVAFLGLAAGVGLVAGRLTRGLGAAAHEGADEPAQRTPVTPTALTAASPREAAPVRPGPSLAADDDFDVTDDPFVGGAAFDRTRRAGSPSSTVAGWDEPLR